MTVKDIIRDHKFTPICEVRPDAKKRITLGRKIDVEETIYRIYVNESGQIILDPMQLIPKREAWLHKNKKAIDSVMRGISEASEGKLSNSPEDFRKYMDE